VRRAAQSAGLITILVNNAGVASVGELLQLTDTQIQRLRTSPEALSCFLFGF
jgi:short-subunit dehydrogenase